MWTYVIIPEPGVLGNKMSTLCLAMVTLLLVTFGHPYHTTSVSARMVWLACLDDQRLSLLLQPYGSYMLILFTSYT